MADEIISYKDAKAKGLKRYRTGKPCKRGHFAERNVANCCCVECQSAVTEKWAVENKKLKNAMSRDWHERNPQYAADWAKKNSSVVRKIKQKWYAANADAQIERVMQWAKDNPEKARAHVQNRRARRIAAKGSHTGDQILELLGKQKWKCAACAKSLRKSGYHIDHIIALINGGSNDISNLQALCPNCNCSKGPKDPFRWAQENGRLL